MPQKAPQHLNAKTRAWWLSVMRDYALEPHHVRLLTLAAEAWDRATEAREAVQEHGLTYLDRYQCPKTRPEVLIERDSRTSFARLLRELDLDIDGPADEARPPMLRRFK